VLRDSRGPFILKKVKKGRENNFLITDSWVVVLSTYIGSGATTSSRRRPEGAIEELRNLGRCSVLKKENKNKNIAKKKGARVPTWDQEPLCHYDDGQGSQTKGYVTQIDVPC
jgi:hypothetical protein